jgi:N-acetylglucosamine kinase-like BadF-type ATPase
VVTGVGSTEPPGSGGGGLPAPGAGKLVAGVDGGSSKTELLVATIDGEPLALVRGPGSNAHDLGFDGCVDVLAELWEQAGVEPLYHGAFFLCGADLPSDVARIEAAVARQSWVREATVDNDTFALLRAGTDDADAVAVVCGSGINCVGRRADGRVARYPSLGWETGDWGGGYMLSREALFLAARAADGRGEPTALVDAIGDVAAYGEAVHYRRASLDLARVVLDVAEAGDAVARGLVERQADEVALLVGRALRDLELDEATLVVGGGLVRGLLVDEIVVRVGPVVVPRDAPVVGATLAALDASGAPAGAGERLREALR